MIRRLVSTSVTMMLLTAFLPAAEREVLQTDWRGFQDQFAARKLNGRSARIALSGGEEIRAKVLGVSETALTVRAGRAVKQWSLGGGQAGIPKKQVKSVRFDGRVGRGRAIGAVAGVAAAAAVAGALVSQNDISEGPFSILIPASAAAMVPIGALVGYFAGRTQDRHAPEFILTH